jgi:DNA polymerase-3 subunit beta
MKSHPQSAENPATPEATTLMAFVVRRSDLLGPLTRASSVAERRSSKPILSNVLLTVDGPSTLRLSATDLQVSVTTPCGAEVKQGGSVALSAKTLHDIVRSLPDETVVVKVGTNHAAEIKSGRSRFRVIGMPGDDFPQMTSVDRVEFVSLPAKDVLSLVQKTAHSMSTDEARPHLAGALFEAEGKTLRMVTTDGHRLSKMEVRLEGGLVKFSMLVPSKGIQELRRLLDGASGDVEVGSGGGQAFFRCGGTLLAVKLVDMPFPPYARVIPEKSERKVVVPRQALADALRRMALVSTERVPSARMTVGKGKLSLQSESAEIGDTSEDLDVDDDGAPVTIAFNVNYVLDTLAVLDDDEVRIELTGELDPCVVVPTGDVRFVSVVMPMRM